MSASEPSYTQLKTNNLPWYTDTIGAQLIPETRNILETYSKIPPGEVESHIQSVRQKLWDIRAYPCTGLFAFLVPWIKYHSAFTEVVSTLKASHEKKILDVGYYIGHDLRALHWAGVPLSSLYGLDIISFADLGWEFFKDADKFAIRDQLFVGDILDFSDGSVAANNLDRKMDVVWCSAVLHQFPWDAAVTASKRLIRFTKGAGSVLIGAQVGSRECEGRFDIVDMQEDAKPFKHTSSSLEKMWQQVGQDLDMKLEVHATWKDWEGFGCEKERCKIIGADMGVLEWTVTIL